MVEEQRVLIGTLKALGYSRIAIIFKYFFFALLISLLGGTLGIICGLQIFPKTIWRAYAIMYTMDPMVLSVRTNTLLVALLGGMAATTLATVSVCFGGLRSVAAELMRPHAPKPGKRVILERITFLWRHIRFSYKVTIRNLFRYKKRFFMAIIGVAGCTAMLLSGFGLRDSIGGMIERQFSRVSHYTVTVALAENGSALENTELNRILDRSGTSVYISQTTVKASADGRSSQDMIIWLNVPEDPKTMCELITLRNRQSGETVSFPDDDETPSVVISEKLATLLNLEVEDHISFGAPEEAQVTAQVSGIMENYFNNYIYVSPEDYKTLFGKAPAYNQVLLRSKTGQAPTNQLMKSLIDCEGVASALSMTQLKEHLENMISSFDQVVWVIILVSALLALVVLYNLTNINVMERFRELATLKVLGFYRREVLSYISRETAYLTLVGIALGLAFGIWLHAYVVRAVEINDVMFVREIGAASYLFAGVFTLLCALAINLAMRPKIRRIDPVLSLKSTE
jgi:putative ABC transport system permease protein